ncbi:hypothetical protein [Streptomyces sp. NRRL S-813]|uniref:hypothetical protein n=1 Tax=Streptomyces sp. NRRL S-813 TaxID=1463919 RepID=UPI0004C2390B|nr:hypothetical protein [Streptomyces sp. NRRL S-813]
MTTKPGGVLRLRARTGTVLTVAVALVGLLPTTSQANVNRYTVQANSPKPAVCNNSGTIPPGTWLQNKPCGYWVGTAMAGSSFDVHQTNPSNYHYGRSLGNNNICAWIPPGALGSSPTASVAESCSDATKDTMSHRRTLGHDFNAAAHDATDGTPITVNPACTAYYNYYTTSTYADGSLRDPAGNPGSTVMYRYTTNGSNPAVVVRDSVIGWIFLSRSCVTDWRGITFYNDND